MSLTSIFDQAYPIQSVILKLVSHCNLNCSYCYWFRDESVYSQSKLLPPTIESCFIQKLTTHIHNYKLKHFYISFHGGEPLLFGKRRFRSLCKNLRELEQKLSFDLSLSISTNGVLLDAEWVTLLNEFRVSVALSIDGPSEVHNKYRLDHRGNGSLDKVIRGLQLLRNEGIEPFVLVVCDPETNPEAICKFLIEDLKIYKFDILVPDMTYEDAPQSIANYYIKLFDLWYDYYDSDNITIRYMENMTRGVLGMKSEIDSIGYQQIVTVTITSDGAIEAHDVLRIAGDGFTKSTLNIQSNEIQDIQTDPLWIEIKDASINLCSICQSCMYRYACGGGHIASRYSESHRYNNPSIYCPDFKQIFGHIHQRVANELIEHFPETEVTWLGVRTNGLSKEISQNG